MIADDRGSEIAGSDHMETQFLRSAIEMFPIILSLHECFSNPQVLKLTCRRFRTKRRNKFACSKISSSMSAMLFALIFPRAQRASTYEVSAERNVWLQSAL